MTASAQTQVALPAASYNQNAAVRFLLSGTAGMTSAACTNWIDVMKVRLQLQGELLRASTNAPKKYNGFIAGTATVVREEGFAGLCKGLTPSLMREATYTASRLSLYEPIKRLIGGSDAHGLQFSLYKKILAGSMAGGISAIMCNPVELLKTRMQAAEVRVFKHTGEAFMHIIRTEGVRGLWRGMTPSLMRSLVVAPSQLATYDHTKHALIASGYFQEGIASHAVASFTASLVATTTVNPFDTIKTRFMTARHNYKGPLDCLTRTIRAEGVLGLYKGWVPQYFRTGPRTFLTFLVLEQLRKVAGYRPV